MDDRPAPLEWGPTHVLEHLKQCGVRKELVEAFEVFGINGETFMSLTPGDFADSELGEDVTAEDIASLMNAIAKLDEIAEASPPDSADEDFMIIPAVKMDVDGKSYFGEHKIPIKSSSAIGTLCEMQSTKGVIFRTTPADYKFDWHPAPSRQYVFNLKGGVQMTVADGTKRIFEAGSVIFMEDTEGTGHCSCSVNDEPRFSVFVPVVAEDDSS
mmetsp:Transcript_31735/g.53318  ORF Transcript_31735/g.53318 Transcript_31735/m.53318 type:complete len:213 (+) Transcript_31735:355-993(+)|eukprot:CAMPEP_0198213340 /NCGR_PEP_ID=MMETSP1445-20131203/28810_1 /TAXON_ID=36898 /ORGANISM="Pyramimonas sp., Strain CCMP2087" /LENGTH=212 /DNA_ID=CAMNT_0043887967 /DNA_START=285 /DNA_END=923 /DNA_ORIENTATION=-